MNALEKLIELNRAILKIDIELFNNIFTNTSHNLELQEGVLAQVESNNTLTNNNIIQQLFEKTIFNTHTMEKLVSSFRENISTKMLMQKISTITDNFRESDKLSSISQLSNVEQTLPTLHTPTNNINSNGVFTKNLQENYIRSSKTMQSSNHSTNIHIDKVEINDVSNVNDLALQLQQKVSTL